MKKSDYLWAQNNRGGQFPTKHHSKGHIYKQALWYTTNIGHVPITDSNYDAIKHVIPQRTIV